MLARGLSPTAVAPSHGRGRAWRVWLALLTGLWLLLAPAIHGADRDVVVLTATGTVDNVMSGYVAEGIAGAERDKAAAVVIQLDTPGGSLQSMLDIVETLHAATVPTVVWVAPAGASAASAGTFITLAANLAYMAPSTTIGAASPVGGNGEDITGTEGQKVKNFAISKIKAIAEERGHNVDWAVSTVESAVSSSASDAAKIGAVNGLASSMDELLTAIEGKQVTVGGGTTPITIDVAGASTSDAQMNPLQGLLHLLSDPNIAFVLFTVGVYGLIFEVIHPNFVTGIVGALAVILALIGFGSLPLNIGGLLLIVLGLVLFGLELTVTSHGLLTVGGVVCFVLGASALYTAPATPESADVSVAFPLIAVMTATTVVFIVLGLGTVLRHRRRRLANAPTGNRAGGYQPGAMSVPAGTSAEVRTPLAPNGIVYAAGEEWSARTRGTPADPHLERGARVRVVGQEGLTLIVEPERAAGSAT